jgi:thiosulfate dehydrogenase
MEQGRRPLLVAAALVVAAAAGIGAGYLAWGIPTNWYAKNVEDVPAGEAGDLIRYGHALIVDTPKHIGKDASDPALRYAGNNLACINCHLNAGLRPFAAPFVSTFASFPMFVNDEVLTLRERINGCMRRSLNGKDLPEGSRELEALVTYMRFVGEGTPVGVRVAGMGLLPLANPKLAPDAARGEKVYAALCATCHKDDGQGEPRVAPASGFVVPPLWGDGSFNAAAGMAKLANAAAYIHANMPLGVTYQDPVLSEQEAWDVAAYVNAQPRPPVPPHEPAAQSQ